MRFMHAVSFIVVFVVAIAVWVVPRGGEAQQAANVPRVGLLLANLSSDPRTARGLQAFSQGLREMGYVEGQNIAIESRLAEGRYERLPGLAAELARLNVKVIVTSGTPAIQAAKRATQTIPIVMVAAIDPVATGFVASLARPGGNITGMSFMLPELVGKQLEMLKEVLPKASRVAVLGNPGNPGNAEQMRHAQGTAQALGVRLQPLEAQDTNGIDSAFAAMTTERADAAIVLVDSMLLSHRTRITDHAARRRLPTVSGMVEDTEAGGLLSYGPSVVDRFRRAATYVDKILKGAKPADLPVEQPTNFELVINLKTAKALGLTIPQSLLQRADQVIQ